MLDSEQHVYWCISLDEDYTNQESQLFACNTGFRYLTVGSMCISVHPSLQLYKPRAAWVLVHSVDHCETSFKMGQDFRAGPMRQHI